MPKGENRNDGRLDLTLKRTIDAPRSLIWKAWTDPKHLKEWWVPRPWTTAEIEMDMRPGGIFRTVMRSPEGENHPHTGCFLEVVKHERIAWTNALEPGFRPALEVEVNGCNMPMTAILTLTERSGRTDYFVRVLHRDEAGRKAHEEMGFHDGWGKCADQLIEVVMRLKG